MLLLSCLTHRLCDKGHKLGWPTQWCLGFSSLGWSRRISISLLFSTLILSSFAFRVEDDHHHHDDDDGGDGGGAADDGARRIMESESGLSDFIVRRLERKALLTEEQRQFYCPQECRCSKIKSKKPADGRDLAPVGFNGNQGPSSTAVGGLSSSSTSSEGKSSIGTSSKVVNFRMACNGIGLDNLDSLELFRVGPSAVVLNLSLNSIAKLKRGSFASLPFLLKLDLSDNVITAIEEDAFVNLTKLQKLDLSGNKLTSIAQSAFQGLHSLQHLNLARNGLTSLPEGSLKNVVHNLKIIDLERNPLVCDCRLKWLALLSKSKTRSLRLTPKSTCHYPVHLDGLFLGKVRRQDMHCEWPVVLSSFELSPNSDQLAFEGDVFSLQCRVTDSKSSIELAWSKDGKLGKPLSSEASEVSIKSSNGSFDGSLLYISSLTIKSLRSVHSGRWFCHVITPHGNNSKSVNLMVISDNASYCPQTKTVTNKGTYEWPLTLSGVLVELPCETMSAVGLKQTRSPPVATYRCTSFGKWEKLNTSACMYISEVTKVLEQFAKTNLSMTQTNGGLDGVRGLRNYTADGSMLRDKMDIVYIATTIHNYLDFVPRNKEVAQVLIDVINTVMNVNPSLVKQAQAHDGSATKILKSLSSLSELLAEGTMNKFNDNLAIEEFIVKSDAFPGIRCTSFFNDYDTLSVFWKRKRSDFRRNSARPEKALHCSLNTYEARRERVVEPRAGLELATPVHLEEASIRLPASLFLEVNASSAFSAGPGPGAGQEGNHFGKLSHKLQFSVFRSAILFPAIETSSGWNQSEDELVLSSIVIGCRIAFTRIANLKNGIEVSLRAVHYTDDVVPVRWDEEASRWTSRGCSLIETNPKSGGIRFKCHHLGHYSLMQRRDSLVKLQLDTGRSDSLLGHYSLFIGAALSVPILLLVILIYSVSFTAIQMPRKTKHSLVNTWLATALLVALFSFGLKQTSILRLCKGIALTLHYLTLSCFLWMIMTSANIYKTISSHRLAEDPDCEQIRVDDESELSPKPKPLLGHYLFGWGIAVIVVGISSAVSLDNYGSSQHCFITFTSNTPVIYGPVAVLLSVLMLIYLLICCLLGGLGTDVVSPRISRVESVSLKGGGGATTKDKCWNLKKQLYLQFVYFCLFAVILGLMCLLTLTNSLKLRVLTSTDNQVIIGSMYSGFAFLLSLYVLIFYCFKRKDTLQIVYRLFFGLCLKDKKQVLQKADVIRTESVRNLDNDQSEECLNELEQSQKEMNNLLMGSKPCPEMVDLLPKSGGVDVTCTTIEENNHGHALSFPQLIADSTVTNEVFLNPRLNAIAKKFFEKNRRRQQLKTIEKNNLNIDVSRIFANDDYINEIGLRSPKRSNICTDAIKAKSEIVPLTKYKSPKYCSSPSSPRPQRLRPSVSAKEVNVYKSNSNVKDIHSGQTAGPKHHNGHLFCKTSHSSHHRKDQFLKPSSSIPVALQCPASLDASEPSGEKDKLESLSVCCQSEVLSSVSQPWSCPSRKSSRKTCNYCQRQRRRQRQKRQHCPECHRKEDRIPENPGKAPTKSASTHTYEVLENTSNVAQRRKRRRRRTSARSTDRDGHSSRCGHFPRSRSVTDKMTDNGRECECRYNYCSSSD